MSWELYEVWVEDHTGHQELIDTTKSLKEAREIAINNLGEDARYVQIYREVDDGDFALIEELTK